MDDYLRSNEYLEQDTEYLLQFLEEQLRGNPKAEENIRIMMGVKESYLESAFQAIEEDCGTMERYLKKRMCLSAKTVEKLQNKYLI